MSSREMFSLDRLVNRWEVRGTLKMESALHIGSGEESGDIDAGVVRDARGRPFIPGASLKGVLRSEAERRAWSLGMTACGLSARDEDPESESPEAICPSARDRQGKHTNEKRVRERIMEKGLDMKVLEGEVCDACRLFGSPAIASRVLLSDLPLTNEYAPALERRDGVGIDRDTGTAAERIKYDFQVVPAGVTFGFSLQAENLNLLDQGLLALVLLELVDGSLCIGGKRSRGLGNCQLVNLSVSAVELSDPDSLIAYLRGRATARPSGSVPGSSTVVAEGRDFLVKCVEAAVRKMREKEAKAHA